MKKLLTIFLLFAIRLCSCATGRTSSAPRSSSVADSSSVIQSSSIAETDSGSSGSSQQKEYVFKDVFLETDPTQSDAYNNAIIVYNDFLESKKHENELPYGVLTYAIIDITGDMIPELLITEHGYATAYTSGYIFVDNNIKELEMPRQRPNGGSFRILSNGMIASEITNTEIAWTFNSYNSNGECISLKFEERTGSYGDEFIFDGEKKEKEEFYILAQPYMDEYEKKAEINWLSYYKE